MTFQEFLGCLVDFFPPFFPVNPVNLLLVKIRKEESQARGPGKVWVIQKTEVKASEVLHFFQSGYVSPLIDPHEIDEPDMLLFRGSKGIRS